MTTTQFRYTFINTGHLFTLIKANMRDCDRGAMSREDCAFALRELADKLEHRTALNAMTLDEVAEHVEAHLKGNKS